MTDRSSPTFFDQLAAPTLPAAARRTVIALGLSALVDWALLAALQLGWYGGLGPVPPASKTTFVVALVPLAVPALMYAAAGTALRRAMFGAALAMLLYFCHGVVVAMESGAEDRLFGVLESVLAAGYVLAYATVGRIERAARQRR